jgi:glycosyltransferase involved in cell wall biosynthesis
MTMPAADTHASAAGPDGAPIDVVIAITTLVAEGTPVMALDLCRYWMDLGIRPAVMTLFATPNDLAPEFERLGVPILRVRMPSTGFGRYTAMVTETARIARATRPRALLSMFFGWHTFVAMGARMAGVPTFAAHVGSYPPYWQGRAFWKFRAEVQLGRPFTDDLVCCSAYVRHGVLRYFHLPERSVSLVYNGCDVDRFEELARRARAHRSPGPFRVGMVARLEFSKDHSTLIRAVAIAHRARPMELWLIGDGSFRSRLEAEARDLGIAAQVRFLGSRRDVPELLGQLDAFAFSVKEDEGLGIALIEAMAANLPIVATDVGACREVLGDALVEPLVPFGDADAMAASLVRLADRPPDHEVLKRASQRARDVFSSRAMALGYARRLKLDTRPLTPPGAP